MPRLVVLALTLAMPLLGCARFPGGVAAGKLR